jgi:hypothetical protein
MLTTYFQLCRTVLLDRDFLTVCIAMPAKFEDGDNVRFDRCNEVQTDWTDKLYVLYLTIEKQTEQNRRKNNGLLTRAHMN